MPFPKALVRREMQTASSRVWTRVADSISNNDNIFPKYAYRAGTQWKTNSEQAMIDSTKPRLIVTQGKKYGAVGEKRTQSRPWKFLQRLD